MSAPTMTPELEQALAAMAPKTVAGYLSLEDGRRFRIEQPVTAPVDSTVRDADGFEICWADDCGEAIGSPYCCDQRPSVVAEYNAHRAVVQQRSAAEIVRQCPVNAGLVAA